MYLISGGVNENKHLCHVPSFCEHRGRKHLPVLSIVFSSIGKKSFIQLHRLKVLFKLVSYNIVLFETSEHIFANE